MQYFKGTGFNKVLLVELGRNEEIFSKLEEIMGKEGIRNAYVASAVGSIAHLEYHRPKHMGEVTDDEVLSIDGPFEFGSITGTIIDGVIHLHFSAGGVKGNHIGHLERGTTVLYLLELLIVELDGFNLERRMTDENVRKLFLKD